MAPPTPPRALYSPQTTSSIIVSGGEPNIWYFTSPPYSQSKLLEINREPFSVYPSGNPPAIGWELNNHTDDGTGLEGNNRKYYTTAGGTNSHWATYKSHGYILFYNRSATWTAFSGTSGAISGFNYQPPGVQQSTPAQIYHKVSLVKNLANHTLGIQIEYPGHYIMSVVRKRRKVYQCPQPTTPEVTPPHIYNDYNDVYKSNIFIVIFNAGTSVSNIFTYLKTNRASIITQIFPPSSYLKYNPIPGNYCNAYLDVGDIVIVYSLKSISEIIFSGFKQPLAYFSNPATGLGQAFFEKI